MTNHLSEWEAILPIDTIAKIHDQMAICNALRQDYEIYPPQNQILNALALTSPDKVKAVIIGQDPYHGKGQAMGLSFSVNKDIPIPPSLRNIYAELKADLGIKTPKHGDLTKWARQGVLLLNASLTVIKDKPNSMANFGWQSIVHEIITYTIKSPNTIAYLCWGNYAYERVSTAYHAMRGCKTLNNKYILRSTHPSPFAANKATKDAVAFLGSRPFSKTNKILESHGTTPIDWRLD